MRKQLCAVFLSIIISISISVTIPRNCLASISSPESQCIKPFVCVFVNSSLYPSIEDEISLYIKDIENSEFIVKLNIWYPMNSINFLDLLAPAKLLKENLTAEYELGMEGAVLIGEMPYALMEESSVYSCDLYLMDLDGCWEDLDGDYLLDRFTSGSGDMYPEIYISRINSNTMDYPYPVNALKNYFDRLHEFKINNTLRHNNGILYIDDDWEGNSVEWGKEMGLLYDNVTIINNSVHETNKSNYLEEIMKPYEFSHVCIHSSAHRHFFKPYETAGIVSYHEINSMDTPALFWLLYCCHVANMRVHNNLANHYLFSSDHTLSIYTSSRSGGFLLNEFLYGPLSEGKTLGQALKYWWFNDVYDPINGRGPSDITMTGNCLLGDPFLRIRSLNESKDNRQDENSGEDPYDKENPYGEEDPIIQDDAVSEEDTNDDRISNIILKDVFWVFILLGAAYIFITKIRESLNLTKKEKKKFHHSFWDKG